MSNYPISIDVIPEVIGRTYIDPELFNTLRSSILAIERTLGTTPASIYTTVKGRLDYIESSLSSGTIPTNACQVYYNDSIMPQLGSTNVQEAIDALKALVNGGGGSGGVLPILFEYPFSIINSENNASGWMRVGTLTFNPSIISSDSNRVVSFNAILEVDKSGAPGLEAEVRLWNIDSGLEVSGSTLTTTSSSPVSLSANITSYAVGSAVYEVQLRKNFGNPGDTVTCTNASLNVRYS